MPTLFDRAVQDIGKYYGVPDKDAKVSFLTRMTDIKGEDKKAFMDYVAAGPIDELIGEMQDRSRPAPGIVEILKKLQALLVGGKIKAPEGSQTTAAQLISKEIRICFEDGVAGAEKVASHVLAQKPDPSGDMQGARSLSKGIVSVRKQLDMDNDKSKLNKSPTSPSKAAPNLSIIQINDCRKTPVSRSTGAVAVFMNSIPTLEWSRCAPRLDITIVSDFAPLSNDNKLVAMGVVQDLLGNVNIDIPGKNAAPSPQFLLSTAVDVSVLENLSALLDSGAEVTNKGGTTSSYSTAGMEMFLSPQTLTSGRPYIDYADAGLSSPTEPAAGGSADPDVAAQTAPETTTPAGGSRPVGVIDRFRPLAGIKDFKVSTHCGPGFISWKTGELDITCYDRSRLYILAPLLKPDRYGRTRLIIDYGWTHAAGTWAPADPDAALASGLMGGSGLRNSYATFLNGMNRKEIFVVTNSTYSFEKDGTIAISVSLSTCGGDRLNSIMISGGDPDLLEQRNAVEEIIKSVNDMRQKILGGNNASAKAIVQESFMNSTATASRALTMNEDTREKLDDFLGTKAKDRDIKKIQDLIDDLLSRKGAAATYKNTITTAISKKKGLMKKKDPWIRSLDGGSYIEVSNNSDRFISFGKIFLHFIAQPIAASGNFEEIQVIFYAINAKASFMHNFNLAQYPIKRDRWEGQFAKLSEGGLNMPLSKFMSFMRNTFISQNADYPYGFNSMYSFDKDDGEYELSKNMKKKDKSALKSVIDNKMKEALARAYKSEGKDVPAEELIFRCPKLSYHVEALKLAGTTDPKTLLRIHIYDAVNSGNTCERQILRASVDNTLGMLGNFAGSMPDKPDSWENEHVKSFQDSLQHAFNAGIIQPTDASLVVNGQLQDISRGMYMLKTNFETIKRFISYNIPSIIYGSNFTSVLSAGLTTMQNDGIAAIMLSRAAGNNPTGAPGVPGGGPPMQFMPTKLSMETMGCPLFEVGQEFFVDFGTGTSMDNIYQIISVTHSINSSGFTSDVDLINQEAYGQWTTTSDVLEKAKTKLDYLQKKTVTQLTD